MLVYMDNSVCEAKLAYKTHLEYKRKHKHEAKYQLYIELRKYEAKLQLRIEAP